MPDNFPALASEEFQALLSLLDAEQTRADLLMNVVIPIGVAMAYERDWNELLQRLLTEAMRLCQADGGFLGLMNPVSRRLKNVLVRVDSLSNVGTVAGKRAEELGAPWLEGGSSERAARLDRTISIADVYEIKVETCVECLRFDHLTGYQTRSCLAVPLRGQAGQVIGVLRLVNARRPSDRQFCPFEPSMQQVVESLCQLAAAAIESHMREQRLRDPVREPGAGIDEPGKDRRSLGERWGEPADA
jgi:sigma-B regulation protein RsbU (phosphoserine phosphatase)